jgi:membrane dipeptidase
MSQMTIRFNMVLLGFCAGALLTYGGLYIAQPERAKAALARWEREHPKPVTTLEQVADRTKHIRQIAGVDHVGLGSDFGGIPEAPRGLEGVDRYPALLAELMRRGWHRVL